MIAMPELKRVGRPESRDWSKEVDDIQKLIGMGYGISLIARAYSISSGGMIKILKRYGLQTSAQSLRSAAMNALIEKHSQANAQHAEEKSSPSKNGVIGIKPR